MKTKLLFILLLVSYSLSSQTALNFDGVNDYVSVPNGGALNNLQTGTIELWVKWNSTMQDMGASGYGAIMARQNDGIGNNQVIALSNSNPNTAKIIWNPYIYTNTVLISTSSPMLNTWVHIAIVYSSGDHKMYINGNLEATSTETGVIANNTVPLTLGAWIDDGVSYSNSYIDEFRIWNTIRTDAEILNTYDKCLTGTENGLVTLWQFEEGTGNTVTDLSGNGYNGTLTNMDGTTAWVTGYNCEPLELVAHYPFNGNANDESGNGNHGTPNGATLTTDRFGNPDSAYSFDGSTNYISIPDNPNINVQTGESFTISYWTKHNAQNNGKYMISKYNGSIGVQPSYALGTGSNGDSYSWFEFTAGNGIENRGNIDLNDTNWHNITTVFKSGESVSIYVDGVLDIQHPATHSGSISNLTDLTIGCGANIAQFYNGKIDDIKIYKNALTEDEIKNETNNLVAYYPFNGNANDESENGNHGTVSGATLTSDRLGNPDSAYSFDGNDIITIAHDDILNCSNELSISVWVKPNSLQSAMILGKSNYTTNTNYLLRTKSTGYIAFEYKDFANSNSLPLTAGIWNHIAVVSQTDDSKLVYINGVLATHTSASSPYGLVTNVLTIGARPGAEFFNGSIDDLRMYKSALIESDVLNLYNNNTLNISDTQMVQNNGYYVYNNKLYFNTDQNLSEIKSISIYNLLVQNVFQSNVVKNELSLDFLDKGIYILKVDKNNGDIRTKKFVIQ